MGSGIQCLTNFFLPSFSLPSFLHFVYFFYASEKRCSSLFLKVGKVTAVKSGDSWCFGFPSGQEDCSAGKENRLTMQTLSGENVKGRGPAACACDPSHRVSLAMFSLSHHPLRTPQAPLSVQRRSTGDFLPRRLGFCYFGSPVLHPAFLSKAKHSREQTERCFPGPKT